MSEQPGPELADVRRYGSRLMTRFVDQAREADRPQVGTMLTEHLGLPADRLPVAEQQWPAYEHVNVQAALDAWLGGARPRAPSGRGGRLPAPGLAAPSSSAAPTPRTAVSRPRSR